MMWNKQNAQTTLEQSSGCALNFDKRSAEQVQTRNELDFAKMNLE